MRNRNGKLILNSADNLIFNTLKRIQLYADSIDFVSANISTSGKLAKKAPIYFTTNRTFTMNGKSYLAYDIDLSLYTNKVDLDGYSHRHFRVKIFFGIGRVDYQWQPINYNISMTTCNTLSIYSVSSLEAPNELNSTNNPYFLYRNSIDKLTFCANTFYFGSTNIKVYTIF